MLERFLPDLPPDPLARRAAAAATLLAGLELARDGQMRAAAGGRVRANPGARGWPAMDEAQFRLAEALIFASAEPVPAAALQQLLPPDADAEAVLAALRDALMPGAGWSLVEVAGGWQFRTAADLAPLCAGSCRSRAACRARRWRRWPSSPTTSRSPGPRSRRCAARACRSRRWTRCWRAGLIAALGRREVPGRPTLWGTTAAFLSQFGLRDLRDLPKREDLLVELPPVVPVPIEQAPPLDADDFPPQM